MKNNDKAEAGCLILVGLVAISAAVGGHFGWSYGAALFGVIILIVGLLL